MELVLSELQNRHAGQGHKRGHVYRF